MASRICSKSRPMTTCIACVQMEKAVRRDAHKMKAFVRFRRVVAEGSEQFIAWHRPDHQIVRLVAPFFARRFPAMNWSILTPDESVHWDQQQLIYGPGSASERSARSDELEELWRTYYASIFNPARIKVKAMIREMPVRHWPTLPETELIPELLADSPRRVAEMIERGVNRSPIGRRLSCRREPYVRSVADSRVALPGVRLYCHATQTVFGEGPVTAQLMLVGEQPGDMEDHAGRPFVGPPAKYSTMPCSRPAWIASQMYMTNAVKHFKFVLRGKKRIHNKPSIQEAIACRPWLWRKWSWCGHKCWCASAQRRPIADGHRFSHHARSRQVRATTWCDARSRRFIRRPCSRRCNARGRGVRR